MYVGLSALGYLVKMGSGAVCLSSKLQPIVMLSTTEAEYVAAGKEICWMRSMLGELGYKPSLQPSKLWVDNQSCMTVAKNPEHHGWMKHLDLAFYWLRDMVKRKTLMPRYLRTTEMPAD